MTNGLCRRADSCVQRLLLTSEQRLILGDFTENESWTHSQPMTNYCWHVFMTYEVHMNFFFQGERQPTTCKNIIEQWRPLRWGASTEMWHILPSADRGLSCHWTLTAAMYESNTRLQRCLKNIQYEMLLNPRKQIMRSPYITEQIPIRVIKKHGESMPRSCSEGLW